MNFPLQPSLDEISNFLFQSDRDSNVATKYIKEIPYRIVDLAKDKLLEKWEITANIKVPHFIIPNVDSYLK